MNTLIGVGIGLALGFLCGARFAHPHLRASWRAWQQRALIAESTLEQGGKTLIVVVGRESALPARLRNAPRG